MVQWESFEGAWVRVRVRMMVKIFTTKTPGARGAASHKRSKFLECCLGYEGNLGEICPQVSGKGREERGK